MSSLNGRLGYRSSSLGVFPWTRPWPRRPEWKGGSQLRALSTRRRSYTGTWCKRCFHFRWFKKGKDVHVFPTTLCTTLGDVLPVPVRVQNRKLSDTGCLTDGGVNRSGRVREYLRT